MNGPKICCVACGRVTNNIMSPLCPRCKKELTVDGLTRQRVSGIEGVIKGRVTGTITNLDRGETVNGDLFQAVTPDPAVRPDGDVVGRPVVTSIANEDPDIGVLNHA